MSDLISVRDPVRAEKAVILHRFRAEDESEGYLKDFRLACDQAEAAGDDQGLDRLMALHVNYLGDHLRSMAPDHLVDHLESMAVWRHDGVWPVFKTAGVPCVAFTAQVGPDDMVHLIALAACYRYPDNAAETWWRQVVRPRVQRL